MLSRDNQTRKKNLSISKCYIKHETGSNESSREDRSLRNGVLVHASV